MVFDKSKDTVYMEKVFSTAKEGETLTIGVYSYNGGCCKTQTSQNRTLRKNKGYWTNRNTANKTCRIYGSRSNSYKRYI